MTALNTSDIGSTSSTEAVYATISYSDVFDMPITIDDLHAFLVGKRLDRPSIEATLAELTATGRIERRDDIVFLAGRSEVVDIYDERTARAVGMWDAAETWGRRVGRLPFVRMVAVTGGLAVDSVADHDDIDFFIVVRPGRLWLTRAMILVLGRVARLWGLDLCPNFIVSEDALVMEPQTIYVARELAQMKVLVGDDTAQRVREINSWMFEHLPNATIAGDQSRLREAAPNGLQLAAERVLLTPLFAPLESWEMNRKIEQLTQVRSRRPEVGAPDESSFSPEVCKGHMVGNAHGIDHAWKQRLHDR